MSIADPQQSFTATLFLNDKPVALAQKVLQKKIEDPDTSDELRDLYLEEFRRTGNLLTFSEMAEPESFFFAYKNGVYTIRIKASSGNFEESLSMEGSLRNWTVFDGSDPTYFRIKDLNGDTRTMTNLSDSHDILLYSGPQERPVCTYGDLPYVQVITDYPNRGGKLAAFKINITKRYSYNGH